MSAPATPRSPTPLPSRAAGGGVARRLAVAMWDFSWLERRFPGGGYEDWDHALGELVERGYDAVRIDAYPHLIAADPAREWELIPIWTAYPWGAQGPCRVRPLEPLLEFVAACRRHGVRVMLSTWFREDPEGVRDRLGAPERHAEAWAATLRHLAAAGLFDALELVDLCNEWPGWAGFFQRTTSGAVDDWTTPDSERWMAAATARLRAEFTSLPFTFSMSEHHARWRGVDLDCLDVLEPHWWMA